MYLSTLEKAIVLLRTVRERELRSLPGGVLWGLARLLRTEKFVRIGQQTVINSFLPPFPGPAFRRMAANLHAIRRGRASPVSAYVAVTSQCGYRCWHCSQARRSGADMAPDTLRKTIAGLQDLGACLIGFTGGEPLLRNDLERLVAAVDERSVSLLFTTGDGLTASRARALRRHGLFGAAVSLDHHQREIHDERRGRRGAYDAALGAIRFFRDSGTYTMLQLVATRDMARPGEFDRYLDLAGRLGVHEIRLLEPMPAGCLLDGPRDCFLTAGEHDELRALHLRTNRSTRLTKVTSFAQIEHPTMYGCGAGRQHLYIDPQGCVCPCDFTPVSFGNVNDEALAVIWERMSAAFRTPRATCFLMDNAARLRQAAAGRLPVPHERVRDLCDACGRDGTVPAFYRILGRAASFSGGQESVAVGATGGTGAMRVARMAETTPALPG